MDRLADRVRLEGKRQLASHASCSCIVVRRCSAALRRSSSMPAACSLCLGRHCMALSGCMSTRHPPHIQQASNAAQAGAAPAPR